MERVGEGTWFALDRKLFTSSLWFDSPWKLKIFIYLVGNANHDTGHFMGIEILRGELIRSYRTIADECGYMIGYRLKKPSFDTVRRICEALTKEQRIVQRTVHCGTLFKIINYDKLQPNQESRTVQRTQEGPFKGAAVTVHNKNDKNVNNEKNKDIGGEEKKRRHQLPSDFILSEKLIQFAKEHGVNGDRIKSVFDHFCEHHQSRGNVMQRWDLAFRTWIRNDENFKNKRSVADKKSGVQRTMEIFARREHERNQSQAEGGCNSDANDKLLPNRTDG